MAQPAVLASDQVVRLREAVRNAYSAAAARPDSKHAFPIGRAFAESLGYPQDLLATLPEVSVDAFAGVSNVSLFAAIPGGATVLDLGCGAGLDTLIVARRAGPTGRAIGIDFSETMLARASRAAALLRANVTFCRADAERLPLRDGTMDVALVNGIFNLNPARSSILGELARVLRPGGAVYAAELILREPLPKGTQFSEADWFS